MTIYRDPKKIAEYLEKWIKDEFAAAGAKKAVLGISGGIDSALLAGLLCRALGPENVTGIMMPCHSGIIDEEYAALLAAKFEFKTYKIDLSKTYDTLQKVISDELGTLDTLPSANIKPRLRMTTLYSIAQQQGALVCGGGNKDEITYGYFTKYGDSGVDLLPLADLLKGEVWSTSEYIGVPAAIIDRPPTAALWEGQTDEKEMGMTYAELDTYIATGNASEAVKDKVQRAIVKTAHKRAFPHMAILPKEL